MSYDTIARAVKRDNPNILVEELEMTAEEICNKLENSRNCRWKKLSSMCLGLHCITDKCPFNGNSKQSHTFAQCKEWIMRASKLGDELLVEAKKRYPIGTVYKCASTNRLEYTVEAQTFTKFSETVIHGEIEKGALYYKGKWAEIVSLPEVKAESKEYFEPTYDAQNTVKHSCEINRDGYYIVKSQEQYKKLLEWLESKGENVDKEYSWINEWKYVCYSVHNDEWELKSIMSNKTLLQLPTPVILDQIKSNPVVPEEAIKPTEFEVGKWYSFDWTWSTGYKIVAEISKKINDYVYFSNFINITHNNKLYNSEEVIYIKEIENIKELSLSEIQQYLPDEHPYKFKTESIPDSPKEITEYAGLKIGDVLPAKIISAWNSIGKNRQHYNYASGYWHQSDSSFHGNRTIESFKEINGVVGFLVSDTSKVYLRADGFKEFMEKQRKIVSEEIIELVKYSGSIKHSEFLMLDSEVIEFQALPKRNPISIKLIEND